MSRTLVKFCGMMRPEDAREAERAGCDAIGVVLWPKSKRAVSIARAREIALSVTPLVEVYGVFVSPTPDEVRMAAAEIGLAAAQLSGPLVEDGWDTVTNVRLVRVIGMNSVVHPIEGWKHAREYVLDSLDADHQGGTGKTFDWSQIGGLDIACRHWLAGGLTPANVGEAIRQARLNGVDVSSGIESSLGIKSVDLMRKFVQAVRVVDRAIGRTDETA